MKDIKDLTIPENVYVEEFDINVRPYLLVEDIINIGNTMVECSDIETQKLVLMMNVLGLCTDIPKEKLTMTENEENEDFLGFDLIILSGLWDAVEGLVFNIDDVWDYVDDKENILKIFGNFIENTLDGGIAALIEAGVEWVNNMPKGDEWTQLVDELPEKLKDILVTVNESDNADILKSLGEMGKK